MRAMNAIKKSDQADVAEQYLLSVIREEHPEWVDKDGSCERCEKYYKSLDNLISLQE